MRSGTGGRPGPSDHPPLLRLEGMFEDPRFEGALFEGELDSLRDGGVKGR